MGLMRPEFAYALLGARRRDNQGLNRAGYEEWSLYFDLCEAILSDNALSSDMSSVAEINWKDVRSAIVFLIERALKNNREKNEESEGIPDNGLARARDILIGLASDPDPNFEADKLSIEWFQAHDPATRLVNHF